MQESEAEKRLQAAVIASAGGYLRNPVRQGGPTYGSSLTDFARAELSGFREVSLAEAEQAIKAIKLWCH